MILCFEGPSAVGKSSLSRLLSSPYTPIPEANLLFSNEPRKGGFWYFEKQTQRLALAKASENAILDGDPFQPLWYNWTYNYPPEFQDLETMRTFYQAAIAEGRISFPDLYCIFSTDEKRLRQRKEGDSRQRRGNFEKHLKLTRSLPMYFGYMQSQFPGLVQFINYDDQQTAMQNVLEAAEAAEARKDIPVLNGLEVLKVMCNWLASQKTP